jgi:epoxyqueuosine reductase
LPLAATTIEALCRREGLLLFGVVRAEELVTEHARYRRVVEQDRGDKMAWLRPDDEDRRDIRRLLPGARSVIVVGLPCFLGDTWPPAPGEKPRVAQYARLADYHRTIRGRGETILTQLAIAAGEATHTSKVFADSSPVLERSWAVRTRTGFIGRNTCFIRPGEGSFFMLGEIVTSMEIDTVTGTRTEQDNPCGECRLCVEACPTGALRGDYTINGGRCLSCLNMETRGTVPKEFHAAFRNYLFGCDICQLVCPHNRTAKRTLPTQAPRLKELPALQAIAEMDQKRYEAVFGGTPMTRAKREGLRRNALVAMRVTGDPALAATMAALSADPSQVIRATVRDLVE